MLGYETTVRVTMEEMLHHTKAVVRGAARALVVGDMPFLSLRDARGGARERRAASCARRGAQAVKVEGGVRSAADHRDARARRHPGHGPHRPDAPGGQRASARSASRARTATRRGRCSPMPWPSRRPARSRSSWSSCRSSSPPPITERLRIPTIGIGAGAGCSGQVQVITDLLGLGDFVRRSTPGRTPTCATTILEAAAAYAADVAAGTFPGPAQTVRMDDAVLDDVLGRGASDARAGDDPGRWIPLDRDL